MGSISRRVIAVGIAVGLGIAVHSARVAVRNPGIAEPISGSGGESERVMDRSRADRLHDAAGRIVSAMERLEYALPGALGPGLSAGERGSGLADFPWHLSGELQAFYAWRNGVGSGSQVDELFPGGSMLSLAQAVATYQTQVETASRIARLTGVEADKLWNSRWFPLFGSHGDFYVVEGTDRPTETSPIYFVPNEGRTPVRKYESLSEMLEVIARCYEQGAYRVGETGVLLEDPTTVAVIRLAFRAEPPQAPESEKMSEIERLVQILATAGGEARGEAASALMERHDPAAVPLLAPLIREGDAIARELSVRVLGEIGGDEAVPPLLEALADGEEQVRGEAIAALGQLRAPQAAQSLVARLEDSAVSVRMRAVWALGELKAREAVPVLAARLNEGNVAWRNAVIQALGKIGDPVAIPSLIELTRSGLAETRILAVAALGELGGDEAAAALRSVVEAQERDEQENASAASASNLESIIKLQQGRQLKTVAQQALAKIDKRRK